MRRIPRWEQLRLGLGAASVLVALALGIFFVDRIGHRLEYRYRLWVYAESARNLAPGSPVWLAGVPVGRVWGIEFRGPETPADRRIAIEVRLRRGIQPLVTEGSTVRVVTAGLLGEAVLSITPPETEAPPVRDGSALIAAAPIDLPEVTAQFQAARALLPQARARWTALRAEAAGAPHLHALLRGGEGALWGRAFRELGALRAEIGQGGGSLARVAADPDLLPDLARVSRQLEEIGRLAAGPGAMLGRLGRDTALDAGLRSVGARADRVRDRLESGRGTAGRLLVDRELYLQWEATLRALRDLHAALATPAAPR